MLDRMRLFVKRLPIQATCTAWLHIRVAPYPVSNSLTSCVSHSEGIGCLVVVFVALFDMMLLILSFGSDE